MKKRIGKLTEFILLLRDWAWPKAAASSHLSAGGVDLGNYVVFDAMSTLM
jgi:hypothetical protein